MPKKNTPPITWRPAERDPNQFVAVREDTPPVWFGRTWNAGSQPGGPTYPEGRPFYWTVRKYDSSDANAAEGYEKTVERAKEMVEQALALVDQFPAPDVNTLKVGDRVNPALPPRCCNYAMHPRDVPGGIVYACSYTSQGKQDKHGTLRVNSNGVVTARMKGAAR